MIHRYIFAIFFTVLLVGCSSISQNAESYGDQVSLPLQHGWHNDNEVLYITTDVSDKEMAKAMNANYAPRLSSAIPRYPKPPQVKTILERVYGFPNGEQSRNVFASVPSPLGYSSKDKNYSPIWLLYLVTWKDASNAIELTSEDAILNAEAQGLLSIQRTNVVVNCPVIPFIP